VILDSRALILSVYLNMSCAYIFTLSTGLWQEIGEPSSVSVSYISGKLVSDALLGKLGSLTYKCYSGVSGCIEPALDNGEQGIYSALYLSDYYKKQVSSYLGAAGVKRVLSVSEGDSKLSFSNSTSEAKLVKDLAKDYAEQAKELADLYNRGLSTARDVSFYTIDPYVRAGNDNNNFGPGPFAK
jgi:hypothetical protein